MDKYALGGALVLLFAVVAVFGYSFFISASAISYDSGSQENAVEVPEVPKVKHVATPKAVRAIYMSQCAATTDSFRQLHTELLEETELNSIIIDVKDFTGTVSFPTKDLESLGGNGCMVPDMKEFIEFLHDKDIYVIGRITVFQDPLYTSKRPDLAVQSKARPGEPWEDYKGLSFVDVGAREFWDYIVEITRESHAIGFDELNFDYVRFPSDGPMSDVSFNHSNYNQRAIELEKFFRYLEDKVKRADAHGHVPVISADLFGMTTTNTDDLTIGQVMEQATPYFDYIAPMTYPSHYPSGFNGYQNPNDNVYGVIKYSMDQAILRLESSTTTVAALAYERVINCVPVTSATTTAEGIEKEECTLTDVYRKPYRNRSVLRPWLQDFDYGGDYGPVEVRAQIQAAYDSGINSWMLWSPSNYYTRGGLKETTNVQAEES